MTEEEVVQNEAALMRTCGHLYVSIALESLATTIMAVCFAYLLLLITNKGRLQTPGKAAMNFVTKQIGTFFKELSGEVSRWSEMKTLPLEKRFALCRKSNQAICMFQLLITFLTIERWLHINNVNGFRYLGYAVTCPPMQAQLVILIAPVVPCFKLNVVVTYFITSAMLISGYAASVVDGNLYDGSVSLYLETGNLDDLKLTTKFWIMFPSAAIQAYLTFVQIPYLALLYTCKGGVKGGLPFGYCKLLLIVSVSWLAFPLWWCLSYEGMSILTDTKSNAAGFALLNVLSKGGFTLQMLAMTKWHRREKKRQEAISKGRRPSGGTTGLFEGEQAAEPPAAEGEGVQVQRSELRTETWLVRMLRPYDSAVPEVPQQWMGLEPTYRAFLVGNRVTPKSWSQMSFEQRTVLREEFDNTLDLVVGDDVCAEGSKANNAEELGEQPPQQPLQPVEDTATPPVKPFGWERATSEGGQTCSTMQSTVDQPAIKGLKIGQTVTTLHGDKGRVLKFLGKEIQIAISGQRPKAVSMDDLTVLKVHFLGARGLSGRLRTTYCSCMIEGRPSSEVQTPEGPGGSKVMWNQEVELLGYSHGDFLLIRLWGRDPEKDVDHILGEVKLPGSAITECGYEGELQLSEDGKPLPAYVSLMVDAIGLPQWTSPASSQPHHVEVPVAHLMEVTELEHTNRAGCCI